MWCTWEAPLAAVARCRFVQDVPMARMTSRRFAGSRHRCPNLQRCPTGTQAAVTPSHLAPNMPVRQTPEEALRLVAFASLLHPCLHLPRCPIGAQATARSSHRTAPRAIGQITAATRRSFPEGYTALWGHRGVFWRPTTALSLAILQHGPPEVLDGLLHTAAHHKLKCGHRLQWRHRGPAAAVAIHQYEAAQRFRGWPIRKLRGEVIQSSCRLQARESTVDAPWNLWSTWACSSWVEWVSSRELADDDVVVSCSSACSSAKCDACSER